MDSRLVQPKFEIPLTEERGEFKLSELFNWKEKKKKEYLLLRSALEVKNAVFGSLQVFNTC